MLDSAETMERHYGHLFDKVIVNGDIAMAFRELKEDLKRIEEASVQWIPAEWVCTSPTRVRRSCGHLSGFIWTLTFYLDIKMTSVVKFPIWLKNMFMLCLDEDCINAFIKKYTNKRKRKGLILCKMLSTVILQFFCHILILFPFVNKPWDYQHFP